MDFGMVWRVIRVLKLGSQFLITGILILDTVWLQRQRRIMRRR